MLKSKEIADLNARITSLEADLKNATDGKAAIEADLNQAKADLEAAQNNIKAKDGEITDLKTKLDAAEKAKTEAEDKATKAEASIADQVNQRLAAAGVDPIARDPKAKDGTGSAKTPSTATGIAGAREKLAAVHQAKYGES